MVEEADRTRNLIRREYDKQRASAFSDAIQITDKAFEDVTK